MKEHEFFFQDTNYTDSPLYTSRLAAFVTTALTIKFSPRRKDYDFFAAGSTSRKLAWRIIEEFAREVTREGARFIIVHIPTKKPLRQLQNRKALAYQELLDELAAHFEHIDPASDLMRAADEGSLASLFGVGTSHYSATGNREVGEAVARALLRRLQSPLTVDPVPRSWRVSR